MSGAVRGWCPGAFEPMRSGDGLLVRIAPRLGRLDAAAARWIGAAAGRLGNGAIELTNRGRLQLRGLDEAGAARFAAGAVAAGLALADPAAERRRAVLVSPLAGDDPGCDPDTLAVAAALEAALVAAAGLEALPGKFGLVVDGGGGLGLGGIGADVALRAGPDGWRVECGGAAARCEAGAAPGLAVRLMRAALAAGVGRPSRLPGGGGAALFAAAGMEAAPMSGGVPGGMPVAVGVLPGGAFGIGLPPGRLDGALLARLAGLAERHGDGTLRPTPWRAMLLAGVGADGVAALRDALPGQLLDPADPRLRAVACIGAPGCGRATVPAPADAAALGGWLAPGATLHVSGCAKGCAHPGAASFTLVGHGGRYDLVRDGRAGDPPLRRGLTMAAAAALLGGPGEAAA